MPAVVVGSQSATASTHARGHGPLKAGATRLRLRLRKLASIAVAALCIAMSRGRSAQSRSTKSRIATSGLFALALHRAMTSLSGNGGGRVVSLYEAKLCGIVGDAVVNRSRSCAVTARTNGPCVGGLGERKMTAIPRRWKVSHAST